MNNYLIALLFFLPAGIANSAPPIANQIPGLNNWKTRLDFGKQFRGQPIFGKNKTWRGLLSGTFLGGLTYFFLLGIIDDGANIKFLSSKEHFMLGAILGFGALAGDAVESFFKRQVGIKPGQSWLFFDQLDYVVGAILISLPFVRFSMSEYAAVIGFYFVMHFVVSYIGYLIGIKENPFNFSRD